MASIAGPCLAVGSDGRIVSPTPRQREALDLATRHGSVRRVDLVARFGISGEAARRDLVALSMAGLLRRDYVRGLSRYVLPNPLADPHPEH